MDKWSPGTIDEGIRKRKRKEKGLASAPIMIATYSETLFPRKLLLYIAAMFTFHKAAQASHSKHIEKQRLNAKMKGVSDLITEGLLRRFSEVPRGSNE